MINDQYDYRFLEDLKEDKNKSGYVEMVGDHGTTFKGILIDG